MIPGPGTECLLGTGFCGYFLLGRVDKTISLLWYYLPCLSWMSIRIHVMWYATCGLVVFVIGHPLAVETREK